jgi:hypothetical protein
VGWLLPRSSVAWQFVSGAEKVPCRCLSHQLPVPVGTKPSSRDTRMTAMQSSPTFGDLPRQHILSTLAPHVLLLLQVD